MTRRAPGAPGRVEGGQPCMIEARYAAVRDGRADDAQVGRVDVVGPAGLVLVTGERTEPTDTWVRVAIRLPTGEPLTLLGLVDWSQPAGAVASGRVRLRLDPARLPPAYLRWVEALARDEEPPPSPPAPPPREPDARGALGKHRLPALLFYLHKRGFSGRIVFCDPPCRGEVRLDEGHIAGAHVEGAAELPLDRALGAFFALEDGAFELYQDALAAGLPDRLHPRAAILRALRDVYDPTRLGRELGERLAGKLLRIRPDAGAELGHYGFSADDQALIARLQRGFVSLDRLATEGERAVVCALHVTELLEVRRAPSAGGAATGDPALSSLGLLQARKEQAAAELEKGELAVRRGLSGQAMEHLERAVELDPSPETEIALAWGRYRLERDPAQRAPLLGLVEAALAADPGLVRARCCLGELLLEMQEWEEAEAAFVRVLAADYEHAEARQGLERARAGKQRAARR